jgi:formylglycine-generating enzyme required for sulfatase activity
VQKDGQAGTISRELQRLLTGEAGKLMRMLETIAYEMHIRQSAAGKDKEVELSYAELVTLLGEEYLGSLDLAREFLDYVDQRAGLLIGLGGGLPGSGKAPKAYKFPHRTFQEYLAGRRLIWGDPMEQQELLRKHAAEGDFWSVPARLAGDALLLERTDDKQYFALVRELTPHGPPANEADARAFMWAARMAAKAGAAQARKFCERIGEKDFFDKRFMNSLIALLGDAHLPPRERAEAGIALAQLGDPRPGVVDVDEMELLPIPAGTFWMGSPDTDKDGYDDERPRHLQTVDAGFLMSRYLVTVAQWRQFRMAKDGYVRDKWWVGLAVPEGHREKPHEQSFAYDNHPADNMSWYDAMAFCAWLTARWRASGKIRADQVVRLPSEAEWERAARGPAGEQEAYQSRPWGVELSAEFANYDDTGIGQTSAVGCFPKGRVPEWGLEEMIGNMLEWTRSNFDKPGEGKDADRVEFAYPYVAKDGREADSAPGTWRRTLRGGAFLSYQWYARAAYRDGDLPGLRDFYLGFRVVVCAYSS